MIVSKSQIKAALLAKANEELNPMRVRCGYKPVTRVSQRVIDRVEREIRPAIESTMNEAVGREVSRHRSSDKSITLK
jgi:chaperone required for assembly of F1-ATPase